MKRNVFSSACKGTFISHKYFYISAFNYTTIIVSSPRDSELQDKKAQQILSISNKVHYGVDGFICYRGEQRTLVDLTV